MQRRTTWKVVTAGAALTGLGLTGVGIAAADIGDAPQSQTAETTVSAEWVPVVPVVDDSVLDIDSPDASVEAMDHSYDDSWEDSWD